MMGAADPGNRGGQQKDEVDDGSKTSGYRQIGLEISRLHLTEGA
jgi:hypothetical protein